MREKAEKITNRLKKDKRVTKNINPINIKEMVDSYKKKLYEMAETKSMPHISTAPANIQDEFDRLMDKNGNAEIAARQLGYTTFEKRLKVPKLSSGKSGPILK